MQLQVLLLIQVDSICSLEVSTFKWLLQADHIGLENRIIPFSPIGSIWAYDICLEAK